MRYEDVDRVKPLDVIFEDRIREFETGSDDFSSEDLKKSILELGDFEMGCRTGRRRNKKSETD